MYLNERVYRKGEKVHGRFHGVPYTGVVAVARAHTIHPTRYEMLVQFDEEIYCGKLYGPRYVGLICSWYDQGFDHVIRAIDEEVPERIQV